MARPLTQEKDHLTAAEVDPDDPAQVARLRKRRLARGRELAGQAIAKLKAAGILDASGRRVRKDLPPDMLPGSKTDV